MPITSHVTLLTFGLNDNGCVTVAYEDEGTFPISDSHHEIIAVSSFKSQKDCQLLRSWIDVSLSTVCPLPDEQKLLNKYFKNRILLFDQL